MNVASTLLVITIVLSYCFSSTANGQSFENDVAELKQIGKVYQMAWDKSSESPDEFVAIVRMYSSDVAKMKEIVQRYQADVSSKSDRGKEVQSAAKNATIGFSTFIDHAKDFAGRFQQDYKAHLERAADNAKDAEKEKLPGLYAAAKSHLSRAEWMVTILVAFNGENAPNAKKVSAEVSSLLDDYSQKEKKLAESTKRVVRAPVEVYRGDDLEKLRDGVRKAWATNHPKDKIVKIVFDHDTWKLNRISRWNGSTKEWQHVDKSALELSVIVEKDLDNVNLFAAFVNRDNLTKSIAYGVDTKGSGFVVDELPRKDVN